MKKILIATHNHGKLLEIKEIFSEKTYDLVGLKDLGISADIDETGKTHRENALIKARHFHRITGLPTIADDSGIIIEALKDELGIHTRRWGAGHLASDQEWLDYFLKKMTEFRQEKQRQATFICCAAYVNHNAEKTFMGKTKGIITMEPQAALIPGIPLSSCFRPEGFEKVYAALSQAEKNRISHRGKAFLKLKKFLRD